MPHRGSILTLAIAVFVSGCTVNIGTSEKQDAVVSTLDASNQEPLSTTTSLTVVDPQSALDLLASEVNALSQSEIAKTGGGSFALLATPRLRLFEFSQAGTWNEVGLAELDLSKLDPLGSEGMEIGSLDYDITIQSVDLTGDGSVEFIIRFRPAPWDLINAPNQGRNFGSVISCDEGFCKPLKFWEPPSFGNDGIHYTVEYIEYIDGVLFAQWYGTCGRPCGLLTYEWVEDYDWLEGREASERQKNETQRLNCIEFRFNFDLPLVLCDEGQPVEMIQAELYGFGYEVDVDGYFGIDTRLAVKLYQKAKGIRATGEVDEKTWSTMFAGMILPGNDIDGDGVITPNELSGT